jgi:copper chaperone
LPLTSLVSIANMPLKGAVGELSGVSSVKVDIDTKTVHIDYDDQMVTLAKIEEVLDEIGYKVAK